MADGETAPREAFIPLAVEKFQHPDLTATGEARAAVALSSLKTLWFNTGTLCNIECINCYIESSPKNDRLVYLTPDDVRPYFAEMDGSTFSPTEIGYTGGEPFMNPHILELIAMGLDGDRDALVLTNAMAPMMRPRIQEGLLKLKDAYGAKLRLRVSLDHYTQDLHEEERGPGAWAPAMAGLGWLAANGFAVEIAGRSCWGETEETARKGYEALFTEIGLDVDAADPRALVLFPEMDERIDVPEITTACWDLVGVRPEDMMCATSRMVVKRKGEAAPVVLPCTLLPYGPAFEMGPRLADATGAVKLNHPHCAKFCVLGGGSCSAG
ncbi:MAG: radical SAM protein [Pseudomonadota bacterium]